MEILGQRWFWCAVCGASVALLLGAEAAEARVLRATSKPAASTAFLITAVAAGAFETGYGRLVLAALAFSAVGDVLLLFRGDRAFNAGLFSFLGAHVWYCAAFVLRGVAVRWTVVAGLSLVAPFWIVSRWLLPKVGSGMRASVTTYMTVITVMVALAIGAYGAGSWVGIPCAAALFYVSDLCVAADTFAGRRLANRVMGLPLYYVAQALFAWSV